VLGRIREVVGGVKGVKEAKAFEGVVGGVASLTFQGKAGAVVVASGKEGGSAGKEEEKGGVVGVEEVKA
jgi:hypothetical protein